MKEVECPSTGCAERGSAPPTERGPFRGVARDEPNLRCIAISPDGKTLASASDDMTALVWDLTTDERNVPAKAP
jgi:WD40 repeat protein